MISTEKCPHCKGAPENLIGHRFKICGYCMQPVKDIQVHKPEKSTEETIGLESVSFLTTSGITAFAIFGLEVSLFNALIFGLITALLLSGLVKPMLLTLMSLGILLIFLFTADKIVEFSLYFIEQVILFFELRNSEFIKGGVTTVAELYG